MAASRPSCVKNAGKDSLRNMHTGTIDEEQSRRSTWLNGNVSDKRLSTRDQWAQRNMPCVKGAESSTMLPHL